MKKNTKNILILVTLIIFLLLSLFNSNYLIKNILDYSLLFLTKLFPVSFIFFIISKLLIDYGLLELVYKVFKINSSKLYILLLSMISGFPSGSKYTKELLENNYISIKDANHIIMYSHFPNPLFVLGSVNLILNDYNLALKILISIITSNIIIFIFNYKSTNSFPYNENNNSFSNNLSIAINDSFNILINIYGISLFFYLLITVISKYLTINSYQYIILNGIFDLTKGVFSTSIISNNIIKAYFILIFISFGSISIHMQVANIIMNTNIKYKYFIIGRIISTLIALTIFKLL